MCQGDDVVGKLMDMFKEFKYTKYDSDQIGMYETVTLKDLNDGVDVPMKFDDNKTFTELQCSSVNAKDDDVTFVAAVYGADGAMKSVATKKAYGDQLHFHPCCSRTFYLPLCQE